MTLNELYEQIGEHLKSNPEHGELIVLQSSQGDMVTPDVTLCFEPCGFDMIKDPFAFGCGYEKRTGPEGKYIQPF